MVLGLIAATVCRSFDRGLAIQIYYSKFAKDHIFFRIVGGMMCIRNLLPILSFKQVTCMSYGLVLV